MPDCKYDQFGELIPLYFVVYVPADLCKLEDMMKQEEKEKKEQIRVETNEDVHIDKINRKKSQEENTKILETAIQESLGAAVEKCDQLIKQGTPEMHAQHIDRMIQPPTKSEKLKYGASEEQQNDDSPPSIQQLRKWLYDTSRAFSQFMRDSNLVEACFGHCVNIKKRLNKTDAAAVFYLSTC